MRKAARARRGIRWNRAVLTTLSTCRVNGDLARLRNSEFHAMEYETLPTFLKDARPSFSSCPVELLEWRKLAAQIRLDLSAGREAVSQAAISLHVQWLSTPFRLGGLAPSEFYPLSEISPNAALHRSLWTADRYTSDPNTQWGFLAPDHDVVDMTTLVKAMKAHAPHVEISGKLALRTARKLHMSRKCGQLGPAQRIKLLLSAAVTPRVMGRFVPDATSAKLPKHVKGSLPSMESAFR